MQTLRNSPLEQSAMFDLVLVCRSCAQKIVVCDASEGEIITVSQCSYCEYDHSLNITIRAGPDPGPGTGLGSGDRAKVRPQCVPEELHAGMEETT